MLKLGTWLVCVAIVAIIATIAYKSGFEDGYKCATGDVVRAFERRDNEIVPNEYQYCPPDRYCTAPPVGSRKGGQK